MNDDYIYLLIVIITIISLVVFMEGLNPLQYYLGRQFRDPDANKDRLVEKLLAHKWMNDNLGLSWYMYNSGWRRYGEHLTYRDKFIIYLAAYKAQKKGRLGDYKYNISAIGQLRNNNQSRSLVKASYNTIDLILRYT